MSSPCNISTKFATVTQVGNTLLSSELESNLNSFIDPNKELKIGK